MTIRSVLIIPVMAILILFVSGCNNGSGNPQQAQPYQGMQQGQPYQGMQQVVPGTQVAQPVQGVPGQIQTTPQGYPTQPTVPGQVVQGVAGQQVLQGQVQQPVVQGQQVVTQIPGAPTVQTQIPGQPVATTPTVATPAAPVAPPTPTGDVLTDKMNTAAFENAKEMKATSMLEKVTLKKGKTKSYEIQLPGSPFCQVFMAVGGENVKEIELKLESPTGTISAESEEKDEDEEDNLSMIASHCPQAPGNYKLHAKVVKGSGEIAVQVFSK